MCMDARLMKNIQKYHLAILATVSLVTMGVAGCNGHRFGRILGSDSKDMVGSHAAGAQTFNNLVEETTGKLLARQSEMVGSTGDPKRVCFMGISNKSAEELGDFRDQLFDQIDTGISQANEFDSISPTYVKTGLEKSHLRPTDLFLPQHMQDFSQTMGQLGQSVDYLLFATLTSGTTTRNSQTQRDYNLSLELIDVNTGRRIKEQTKVRKGYHKSRVGSLLQEIGY